MASDLEITAALDAFLYEERSTDSFRDSIAAALEAAEKARGDGWLPIESAPEQGRILAAIWHGIRFFVVIAEFNKRHNGWLDIRGESSVAWIRGSSKHPSYWQPLPPSPEPTKE